MADPHEEHSFRQDVQHTGGRCFFFEIRVRGHLSAEWSDWFENLDIRLDDNGVTVLSGPIEDQAALMGILNRLNGLNLTLLSINEISQYDIAEGERNGSTTSVESQT